MLPATEAGKRMGTNPSGPLCTKFVRGPQGLSGGQTHSMCWVPESVVDFARLVFCDTWLRLSQVHRLDDLFDIV